MSETPLVSVVTSVLNAGKTLEKTIDSVAAQTYKNIEYIVIDGGSWDGSLEILKRRHADIDVLISEPDNGVYDAWNKALNLVSGQWVMFLGADDELLPESVEFLIGAMNGSPVPIEFVSGRVKLGNKIVGSGWNWRVFRRRCSVAHCGAMHSIKLFEKYGKFDASFRIAGDYEFLLRAGKHLKSLFVDRVIVEMGQYGLSNSNPLVFREASRAKRLNRTASFPVCIMDWALDYGDWCAKRLLGRIKTLSI